MSMMPKTSMKFIHALCAQSRAGGRAEEISFEDVKAGLGLDCLNGYEANKKPPNAPREDKL